MAIDLKTQERIQTARDVPTNPGLLTIGYEGKSLECYLNQLIRAGVTLLCDVRRNPFSRKYGFSKSTLSNACLCIGIRYEHLPELGIASDRRRGLSSQTDYDELFADYEQNQLPRQKQTLETIQRWVANDDHRVALTCFELDPGRCHRHCVAKAIQERFGQALEAQHL